MHFLLFASLVAGLVPRDPFVFKEHAVIPHGWSEVEPSFARDDFIQLDIGLVQQNLDRAAALLHRISDPLHESFGEHLSQEQLHELVSPHESTRDGVRRWLAAHGVDDVRESHASVQVVVPISKAEQMLDAEYATFEQRHTGKRLVRARSYSIPRSLVGHIDIVQPTTLFGSMHEHAGSYMIEALPTFSSNNPVVNVTPASLRALYKIGDTTAVSPKSSVAVASYLEQYANYADYRQFVAEYAPYVKTGPSNSSLFNVTSIQGGQNLQDLALAGGEANLDVQYLFGLTGGNARKTDFTTGGRPPFNQDANGQADSNEPYLAFLDTVLAPGYDLPDVLSTSYGDDEQTVPESYARRVCDGFLQLGLRGTSVLFSSGDNGVGAGGNVTDAVCKTNDGRNASTFLAIFPASCPYVTGVGGTTSQGPEVAVEIVTRNGSTNGGFFSGGGFSRYFPTPAYQIAAVAQYIPKVAAYNATYLSRNLFNPAGRGFPDVAFQSWRFFIVLGGRQVAISGTSAASPGFAAVVGLLNDARRQAGKKPLGFLNPLFYNLPALSKLFGQSSTGLNDITIGSNPGCGTNGFPATTGWDAVTALGTPDFATLRNIVTKL